VFALNLSQSPVSLSLVRGDQTELAFVDLAGNESRALTVIAEGDGVVLRQKAAGTESPAVWSDPSGAPYLLRFQTGSLYAVIVDPLGQAAVYNLPETYRSDPKLCIINDTGSTLSQVQAAPAWAKNVKVYAQDVVPVVPSEFYSLDAKTLGLYWQTLDQVASGDYNTASGLDGKPLRLTFEPRRYYLFLAGSGSIRDLTPTID